jgi:hypothetical protein
VKALLSLFAAIRPHPKNAVANSAVQMHFLPNRELRLATSAKDSSPESAEMAAEGVLVSSTVPTSLPAAHVIPIRYVSEGLLLKPRQLFSFTHVSGDKSPLNQHPDSAVTPGITGLIPSDQPARSLIQWRLNGDFHTHSPLAMENSHDGQCPTGSGARLISRTVMTMFNCHGKGGFSRTNQQKKLPKRLQFGNSCI